MKVGILGTGNVGRSLGNGFLTTGHEVMVAGREDNEAARAWVAGRPGAASGSFATAAGWAELVVLATAWSGTEAAISLAGPDRLAGKTLIDVVNPLAYVEGRPMRLALGHDDSCGESVQRWATEAHVVKAFNTVGHELMFRPQFASGIVPDMYFCGNDAPAKARVAAIVGDFGWTPVEAGDIAVSRLLEPLAMLWITLGARGYGWDTAFTQLHGAVVAAR